MKHLSELAASRRDAVRLGIGLLAGPAAAQPPAAPAAVGLTVQNAGTGPLPAGFTVSGQAFRPGDLPAGMGMLAKAGDGSPQPAQVDVTSRHPDGSARLAIVTFARPALPPGRTLPVQLVAAASGAVASIDLAGALARHACTVTLAITGGPTLPIDVLAALRAALAGGGATIWLHGPLVTQARVVVLVPGRSMRLICDVSAFADGALAIDVQFANDRAMEAVGGRVAYTVTMTLNGATVLRESVDQLQYQNWHRKLATAGAASGWQGLRHPAGGWLNIRHDIPRLIEAGAIARYDLSLQIPVRTLEAAGAALRDPSWNQPLGSRGVRKDMPDAGGRPDIGITTAPNIVWLLSGDARAAAYALGQAEAASVVPWHFWDATRGRHLSVRDYPRLWVDNRGGLGRPGDAGAPGLTQLWEWEGRAGWSPETAHQPDLSFVPFLLTGERWMLDNLQAQAAWNLLINWPGDASQGERYNTVTGAYDLVVRNVQVRAAAWALRQLDSAAWASPDGSPEQAYFADMADANWTWLVAQLPAWTALEGEVHGYLPNYYWYGLIGFWSQDFFAAIAIAGAKRGNDRARTVLAWMRNALIGRFTRAAAGFNPRDGIAYQVVIGPIGADGFARTVFRTWGEVGRATVAAGKSNGTGWARSEGSYGQLALSTLAGLYHLTGDADARAAYVALAQMNPPETAKTDFEAAPNFAVTIPGIYGR